MGQAWGGTRQHPALGGGDVLACGCPKGALWLPAFWVKIPSFGELPDVMGSACWRWAAGRAHLTPLQPSGECGHSHGIPWSPCPALMAGQEGGRPQSFSPCPSGPAELPWRSAPIYQVNTWWKHKLNQQGEEKEEAALVQTGLTPATESPKGAAQGASSALGLVGTELPWPKLPSHCSPWLGISVWQRQKRGAEGCTLHQANPASPCESTALGTWRCINGSTLSSRNKPH